MQGSGQVRGGGRVLVLAGLVAVAVALAGGAAGAQQPPTTTTTTSTTVVETTTTTSTTDTTAPPVERDPSWAAQVELGCGPTAGTRVVAAFVATAPEDAEVQLYEATPQSGGEALRAIGVGDTVSMPAALRWSIIGVPLGPWAVDTVVDTCEAAATTVAPATTATTAPASQLPATGGFGTAELGLVGLVLIGIGVPLARRVRRETPVPSP